MGTLVNGIKEIFATSQTTATHLPVCASDGTPQGRISVGDLASVLGACVPRSGASVTDFNSVTTTGCYLLYNTTRENAPSFTSGLLFVTTYSYNHIVQIVYQNNGNKIAMRHYWAGTWQAWHEFESDFPSFYKNYSTLASLKSDGIGIKTATIEQQAAAQSPYFSNKWVIDTGLAWTNRLVIGFLDNRNGWHYNFTHDSTNWYIIFDDNSVPSGVYAGTLVYLQM